MKQGSDEENAYGSPVPAVFFFALLVRQLIDSSNSSPGADIGVDIVTRLVDWKTEETAWTELKINYLFL